MRVRLNLASDIRGQLPADLVAFMERAGATAARRGERLYLVGGVVRDLLLHRANLDLDLVVEGDAVSIAKTMASALSAKLTIHIPFKTAKLSWDRWTVDLAMARSESYAKPGALPRVRPGVLESDLYRRDFTINAMAVDLNPERYGELIDLHGGIADLGTGMIRVLHDRSFIDDATRIWRAIRYEQRLGFRLELETERLLKRDIGMLDTITGARIRHELELVLKEDRPEMAIRRVAELGVLQKVHPSLKGDNWVSVKFRRARSRRSSWNPSENLYFALLGYRLSLSEAEHLLAYLRPSRVTSDALIDTIGLRMRLDSLAAPGLPNSAIATLLEEYSDTAIRANRIAADSPVVRRRLKLYLERLRRVKPELTGDSLVEMGVTPGPEMKAILRMLKDARLDGRVRSRGGEMRVVEEWKLRRPKA